MPTLRSRTMPRAYLRLDISVVVVLEEQGGRLGVVLACSDVQGRKADLSFSIILQQDRNHLVVALLEGDGQRGEAILDEGRRGRDGRGEEMLRGLATSHSQEIFNLRMFNSVAVIFKTCNTLYLYNIPALSF